MNQIYWWVFDSSEMNRWGKRKQLEYYFPLTHFICMAIVAILCMWPQIHTYICTQTYLHIWMCDHKCIYMYKIISAKDTNCIKSHWLSLFKSKFVNNYFLQSLVWNVITFNTNLFHSLILCLFSPYLVCKLINQMGTFCQMFLSPLNCWAQGVYLNNYTLTYLPIYNYIYLYIILWYLHYFLLNLHKIGVCIYTHLHK